MLQGYGMTEAGPVLAMCSAFAKEPFEVKSGGCGSVVRNAEMKIVDPETGSSLPRNQPGEICIRGDQIMQGNTAYNCVCVGGCERFSRPFQLLNGIWSFGPTNKLVLAILKPNL